MNKAQKQIVSAITEGSVELTVVDGSPWLLAEMGFIRAKVSDLNELGVMFLNIRTNAHVAIFGALAMLAEDRTETLTAWIGL